VEPQIPQFFTSYITLFPPPKVPDLFSTTSDLCLPENKFHPRLKCGLHLPFTCLSPPPTPYRLIFLLFQSKLFEVPTRTSCLPPPPTCVAHSLNKAVSAPGFLSNPPILLTRLFQQERYVIPPSFCASFIECAVPNCLVLSPRTSI